VKQIIQSLKTGEIAIEEVPEPIVRPGGVLVATLASLVSAGTERQVGELARKSLLAKAMARPDLVRKVMAKAKADGWIAAVETVRSRLDSPFALGYSAAGVVIEAGRGVEGFAPGELVACGGQGYASHAQVIFVPENLCVRVPPGVDAESAAFVSLGAIALQSVRQADVRLGETVGVIGLGLIGQIVVQLLKASGCTVLGNDPNPDRAALAKELGCDEAVAGDPRPAAEAATGGRGLDCVIIAASTPSDGPVETAGDISRQKGRVVVLGSVGMNVPRKSYYERELDLRMSTSYGPGRYDPAYEEYGHDYPYAYVRWTENRNMAAFLHLVAQGKVNVARLATHRFEISRGLEAYELLEGRRSEPYLGIVLTYPERPASAPAVRRVEIAPPAAVQRPAAAQEAVIGVIGAGNFAQSILLPRLKRIQGCRLRGIADLRGEVAKHAARKFGFETCCSDGRELLADPAVNAVIIATRHNTHARMVCAALEAGKHAYVEKPLCMDESELAMIAEAHGKAGGRCILMVGYNRRFAPLMRLAEAHFCSRGTPLVMSFRVNAGPVASTSWVLSAEEGGGRVIGEVCHFVDALSFLADAAPESLCAASIAAGAGDAAQEENISVSLRFADGSLGNIVYTSVGDKAMAKEYLEVFGGGRAAALDNFRRLALWAGGRAKVHKSLRQHKGHLEEMQAFVHAVRSGGPAPIPFESLAATSQATFQIVQRLNQGLQPCR